MSSPLAPLALAAVALFPLSALSQEPPGAAFTLERRMELYERARIEPSGALLRSAVAPGWGNVYANRIFKGVAFGAGFAMAAFVGTMGIIREDKPFTYVGVGTAVGLWGTALATSYFDALEYNESLRKRYKVDEPAPTIAWRWSY